MPAYFIIILNKITDAAELAEYRRIGVPSMQSTNVKFRIRPGPFELLEGEPAEAVVMLEFPTMEEAREWYQSPTYQEALVHRRKGAECHAFLVEGS